MPRVRFPIHHTFGPLVTNSQWRSAFSLQFQPNRWQRGPETEELRQILCQSFGMSTALFATGREALLAGLRTLHLKAGEEVLLPAFTCAVLPNAIHAAGGTPMYCDIDPETLGLDLVKIQSRITPRARAVICQHTFGIPVHAERLRAICDKRKLLLIEDCAHVIPDTGVLRQMSLLTTPSSSDDIGVFGDMILMSFGRDKAISGVSGGAILLRDSARATAVLAMEKEAAALSHWKILNLIDYPIRYRFAKWLWRLPAGSGTAKAYLRWIRFVKFLPPVLSYDEKRGRMPILLRRIPNACAILALEQLRSLAKLNEHRCRIASLYMKAAKECGWMFPAAISQSPALQKFPVYARDAEGLRSSLKREHVYLDDGWCGAVVNPPSADQEAMGYAVGSCPVAEDIARHIVALPTHPTMTEAQAAYLIHALRARLR